MAIPRARGVGRPLVAGSPQERCDLVLDSALQDELCTEASEGAEGIGSPRPPARTASMAASIWTLGLFSGPRRGSPDAVCNSASEPTLSSLFQRSQDATRPGSTETHTMNPLCRRDLRRARRSSLPPPSLTPNGVDRVGLAGHRGRLIRSREGGANGPTIERTGRASVCRGDGRSRRQRARSVAPPRLVGRVAAVWRTGTGACQRPGDHRELARWSADGPSEPRRGRRRPLGHDALVYGPAGRWLGGLLGGRRNCGIPGWCDVVLRGLAGAPRQHDAPRDVVLRPAV